MKRWLPLMMALPLVLLADENVSSAATAVVQTVAAAAPVAPPPPKLDSGNTAWMIVATALVMLMTPAGLALFYGGMTRTKNLLNTISMSAAGYALACVTWIVLGYTLAFGTDINGFIGSIDNAMMNGIKVTDIMAGYTIPTLLYVAFQMTFAAITVALASGSVIDRLKFSTWMIFVVLWIVVVYAPIAHWVWGGGFLTNIVDPDPKKCVAGALDFAGGTVVHINAGVAGLVMALMLGKRKDFGRAMFPSSVTLTTLGAILLWFGWFGFNAGSEVAADGIAASAFMVTNTAASLAAITWMLMDYLVYKKFTLLGFASGAVAGLVAITPASGFVDTTGSLIIGLGAGMIGFIGVNYVKKMFGYDDSLDAFGVHALCGIFGALATGVLANPAVNSAGTGLLFGNAGQMAIQIKAILVTIVYSAVGTAVVFGLAKVLTGGGRVSEECESIGQDEMTHGEKAFHLS